MGPWEMGLISSKLVKSLTSGRVDSSMTPGALQLCRVSFGQYQASAYAQDPVHRLAWSLDACLKDRVLDEKRMRELHQFFVPLDRPPAVGKGPCERLTDILPVGNRDLHSEAAQLGSPGGAWICVHVSAPPYTVCVAIVRH